MPLTSVVADALGVVTISLVAVLGVVGLLCILYSFYFRHHIRSQGCTQLGYFSGPWVIRISFILFAIWWGVGEILRLEFLRREGRLLHALGLKWQETVCKWYIVSNLGFAEPCLFLSLVFLLRGSLQKTESGPLSQRWNMRTTIYILVCSLSLFALQMTVVWVGPQYETDLHLNKRGYFFKISGEHEKDVARCYYPLLSTIFLGVFATVVSVYLLWVGRRILILVINKGLQMRVYTLIFFVSSLFPLRVVLLGLSVVYKPGDAVFEVLAFLAFLCLLCCAAVGICMLVYLPIADALALRNNLEENESLSLIANSIPAFDDYSVASTNTKQGSISFRTMERDEGGFVELSLFQQQSTTSSIASPGWP